jgi:hypothetical protein
VRRFDFVSGGPPVGLAIPRLIRTSCAATPANGFTGRFALARHCWHLCRTDSRLRCQGKLAFASGR